MGNEGQIYGPYTEAQVDSIETELNWKLRQTEGGWNGLSSEEQRILRLCATVNLGVAGQAEARRSS